MTTKTAPDPSYPGAHSATSSAGAEVLRFYFEDNFTFDVTSEVLPGVTRHFTAFSAAAQEAGLSRIYAGQHFRFDHVAGLRLGEQVSNLVTHTVLLPAQTRLASENRQENNSRVRRDGSRLVGE